MDNETDIEESTPEGEEEEVEYPRIEGAGMQWLRRLSEGDGGWRRLAGMIVGLTGAALIITGAFFFHLEQNNYSSSKPPVTYTIDKAALILGAAIIISILLAWWWRSSYVGCIMCLVAGGYTLYTHSGYVSLSSIAGTGPYLVYGGSLLAILGGLIMLAERRAEVASELDWQDARFSSLERAVGAMLDVWEEADRVKEAALKGEVSDTSDYDRAAAEAEKTYLVHKEIFEE